jgi:hypothetical protein
MFFGKKKKVCLDGYEITNNIFFARFITCVAAIYKGKRFLRNEVRNYSNSPFCVEAVTTYVPELLRSTLDRCSGAAVAVACVNHGKA